MDASDIATRRAECLAFLEGRIDYERTCAPSRGTPEFKLERMRRLMHLLANPHERLPTIHIAGTKGKGSTAAMVASILRHAGYRTGMYSSPHLERIEERFDVGGEPCSAVEFIELIERVRPLAEQLDRDPAFALEGPTFFELATAAAFEHFSRRQCEALVLEVGLGGRLDSTNVCHPRACVITTIGLDHTKQLGDTLEKIAWEKAGIVKPGIPVVSGVTQEGPRRLIEGVCAARHAPLRQLHRDFGMHYTAPAAARHSGEGGYGRGRIDFWNIQHPQSGVFNVEIGLAGPHQGANAALAMAVVDELRLQGWRIPDTAVRDGLSLVRCPGRVEVLARDPLVVLDTAHNVSSIEALLATLAEFPPVARKFLIFGASRDKDVRRMLSLLLPYFDETVFTKFRDNPRGLEVAALNESARRIQDGKYHLADNPLAAWSKANSLAGPRDMICITGSFFLAAELRAALRHELNPVPR